MSKVFRNFSLDQLVSHLSGQTVASELTPWRSQVRALSKAITYLENESIAASHVLAHPLLCLKPTKAWVIGITGLPGAGKSSLTNLLIKSLRMQNRTVAVLAVDPSSTLSGGAILGDRVRMQEHFRDEGVFIRSMANRGTLGGVARATRGAIRMASQVGFDVVIVETVGIGQSESAIVQIADTTCMVLMPNSGDEIQMMKSGILQLADVYVLNKCDLSDPSRMSQEIHENTAPSNPEDWCPPIVLAKANQDVGGDALLAAIEAHQAYTSTSGRSKKTQQLRSEVLSNVHEILEPLILETMQRINPRRIVAILDGKETAMSLAKTIADQFIEHNTEGGL